MKVNSPAPRREIRLKGIGVSPGIVSGKILVLAQHAMDHPARKLAEKEIPAEVERLHEAVARTRVQLVDARDRLTEAVGREHAYIIDVHLMFLDDQMLIGSTENIIRSEALNAEAALRRTIERIGKIFADIEDTYLRERSTDIEQTGARILHNLAGYEPFNLATLKEEVIVIAHDLSPADTASMDKAKVLAFATNAGSRTSHTAIMARALEIPAVLGLENITSTAANGDLAIIDGTRGEIVINPAPATLKEYRSLRRKYLYYREELDRLRESPAETTDGYRVALLANLEIPEEMPAVKEHGAQGIGLYRTEFLYLNRPELPTEEEHYTLYRELAERVAPGSATIRTVDLGGDKFLAHVGIPDEMNPAMGLRAIRFCLKRIDLFTTQLRAILRASAHGRLKIMIPMISSISEITRVRELIAGIMAELDGKGIPFDRDIELGAMIEIPSAALTSEDLAREVDFLSIGTNDLIQYTLAIDRVNEHVAYLYEPLHPAVLRLIIETIKAGHKAGISVSMCGEMAGDPLYTLVLIGLGLDELSMNPLAVPRVKKIIRTVDLATCRDIAAHVAGAKTSREAEGYLKSRMAELFPEDITLDGTQVCLL